MSEQWFVLPLNPYPWKVPPMSAARKGNKLFVRAGRDEGLHTYKEAIRDILSEHATKMITGGVSLRLWFWRNIPEYTTHQGRTARKHEADATNIQKATEDALQGIFYKNDKDVRHVESYIVEQSSEAPSILMICVSPYDGFWEDARTPVAIREQIDELTGDASLAQSTPLF